MEFKTYRDHQQLQQGQEAGEGKELPLTIKLTIGRQLENVHDNDNNQFTLSAIDRDEVPLTERAALKAAAPETQRTATIALIIL